jgi:hypothetical protein
MAVTKLQAPLSELRGTIGGVTYSVNASTRYAKAWSMPAYHRTAAQSAVRNSFADAALKWRALTPTQRNVWKALAAAPPEPDYDRFGTLIYLTGLQWFQRCNTRLLLAGQPTIQDAPTTSRPDAFTDFHFAMPFDPPYAFVTFGSYPQPSGAKTIVFGAWTRSQSVTAVENDYRYLTANPDRVDTQASFTDEWYATFPLTTTGSRCWISVCTQDQYGLRAQWSRSDVVAPGST